MRHFFLLMVRNENTMNGMTRIVLFPQRDSLEESWGTIDSLTQTEDVITVPSALHSICTEVARERANVATLVAAY